MAEIVLKGDVQIAGGEEGSRHLLILDSGNLYRIALRSEGAKELGEKLQLDDEQMAAEAERAMASKKIVMPGNGGPPHANLN